MLWTQVLSERVFLPAVGGAGNLVAGVERDGAAHSGQDNATQQDNRSVSERQRNGVRRICQHYASPQGAPLCLM